MSQGMGNLRRVPWTCEWGQFGGTLPISGSTGEPQAQRPREWTPWRCLHPRVGLPDNCLHKGDCDNCPFWNAPTPRHRDQPGVVANS